MAIKISTPPEHTPPTVAKICHSHREVLQEAAALYRVQPVCSAMKLAAGSHPQQLHPQPPWASFTPAGDVSTATAHRRGARYGHVLARQLDARYETSRDKQQNLGFKP